MSALGPDLAAKVYAHLGQEEIEQLTLAVARQDDISDTDRREVLQEFCAQQEGRTTIAAGGPAFARAVLERALGLQRTREILGRIAEQTALQPFEALRALDLQQLTALLGGEHPQTIALVLSFLEAGPAASILKTLTPEQQGDVAERVATMERINPVLVASIASVLERKIAALFGQDLSQPGGVNVVVDVLNQVDRATERSILGSMEGSDPDLVDEIRRRMFLFEDFQSVDDRYVQRIVRDVDQTDLVLALKGASDALARTFFRNMSQRMAEVVHEELNYLGPTRLRDVEAAQQRVVALARRLEDAGEVILNEGSGDQVLR